jgi:hypothetical protein
MYQHWELTTSAIGVLQEATDTALDATAEAGAGGAAGKAPPDAEAAGHTGGLHDWQLLRQEMEAASWSSRAAKLAKLCRVDWLAGDLAEREVRLRGRLVWSVCEVCTDTRTPSFTADP